MSPQNIPRPPLKKVVLQAWGIPRHPPRPDELLKRWQVCPTYAIHLGGFCSKCHQSSKTLYCQTCHRKTRPHMVTCHQCLATGRSFRLLVEWLRFGKFKGSWINELSQQVQQVFTTHHLPSVSLKQRSQSPLIFSQDLWGIVRKRLSPPDSQRGFYNWLLLAWSIQQGDQEKAVQNKALTKLINQIHQVPKQSTMPTLEEFRRTLLVLSYVPQPLLVMAPSLRTTLPKFRKSDSTIKRRQSQLVGSVEEPKAEMIQEQLLFSRFGIDKMTHDLSRQVFWTWLFVPLVEFLLPYATRLKQDRWKFDPRKPLSNMEEPIIPDDVFIKASQLLHLRYPDLWNDHAWQMVKLRFHRQLRPHAKKAPAPP